MVHPHNYKDDGKIILGAVGHEYGKEGVQTQRSQAVDQQSQLRHHLSVFSSPPGIKNPFSDTLCHTLNIQYNEIEFHQMLLFSY